MEFVNSLHGTFIYLVINHGKVVVMCFKFIKNLPKMKIRGVIDFVKLSPSNQNT
jgi:hypothetical protein